MKTSFRTNISIRSRHEDFSREVSNLIFEIWKLRTQDLSLSIKNLSCLNVAMENSGAPREKKVHSEFAFGPKIISCYDNYFKYLPHFPRVREFSARQLDNTEQQIAIACHFGVTSSSAEIVN